MAITNKNIRLQRGDDESILVKMLYPDKSAVDLHAVARADLHAITHGQTVLNLSTESGGAEFYNKVRGELLLFIPRHLTQLAGWTRAQYDLQLSFISGRVQTVLSGEIQLNHDITSINTAQSAVEKNDKLANCKIVPLIVEKTDIKPINPSEQTDNNNNENQAIEVPDWAFLIEVGSI